MNHAAFSQRHGNGANGYGSKPQPEPKAMNDQQDPGAWYLIGAALIASWGGAVRYVESLKRGRKHEWTALFSEVFVSAFVGLIFGLCLYSVSAPVYAAFAGAGIAGHMGTRALMGLRDQYNLRRK